jgi:ABC-type transport system involved in multi-copper enzyme maturation permease subunit
MTAIQTYSPSTGRRPSDPTPFNRPSLGRLARVEVRKSWDTRAGLWLLILIAALTVGITTAMVFLADDKALNWDNFTSVALGVQGFILPVLGILLVTSEWSQRTGLVTFSLVPSRARVVRAKLCAGVVLAAGSLLLALAVGAVANSIGGRGDSWNVGLAGLGEFGLLQLVGIVQGIAFGMLIMNSPAAIVTFFILPTAWSYLTEVWSALAGVQPWLDVNAASQPLWDHQANGADWVHFGVAALIWLALPLMLGTWRLLRAELK